MQKYEKKVHKVIYIIYMYVWAGGGSWTCKHSDSTSEALGLQGCAVPSIEAITILKQMHIF